MGNIWLRKIPILATSANLDISDGASQEKEQNASHTTPEEKNSSPRLVYELVEIKVLESTTDKLQEL